MATLNENPYKRFKKAGKMTGMEVNAMAKRSVRRKSANWIQGAIKKPGALHKELGVPEGKKIPADKLHAASKKGGKEGARARLAETLKGLKHKKAGRKEPTVKVIRGDVEMKAAKKRKGTIGFADMEHKSAIKKKSAVCMKCKGAHKKHEGKA